MGNEHEVMRAMQWGLLFLLNLEDDAVEIVTDNDMEVRIDDHVFRIHVEGDIV